ncbi:hypothetical protein QL285_008178 [Trifolium repens]|nr:hypothetical protein QL285_008178 [Trifolium repens]
MDSFTHFRQPGYSRKNTENSIVQQFDRKLQYSLCWFLQPDQSIGLKSILVNFQLYYRIVVNEEILLTFLAASKVDTPLQCRTIGQKLVSSCSQARNKLVNIYSGNVQLCTLK